jgi:hypothetical protein
VRNVLVITEFLGLRATGLVVQEYIEGLILNGNNVSVLTLESKTNLRNVIHLPVLFNLNLRKLLSNKYYSRLDKVLMLLFNRSIDEFLVETGINHKTGNQYHFNPDIIIHFVSGDSLISLFRLADVLKKKFNSKYFIHFLDPKPGLQTWNENPYLINVTKRILFKYINIADRISAINFRMLDVIKSYYSLEESKLFVLPIPINENINKAIEKNKKKEIIFSYFGSIYGKRDVSFFFQACNYLHLRGYQIMIYFFGTNLDKKHLSKYPNLMNCIKFFDWVEDIENLINASDYLVDINANIKDDPFISSKLFKYLGFSKPIIVFSNTKSASNEFAKEFESVYLINYNIEDLESRILQIISCNHFFNKREFQIKKYSSKAIMREYLF